MNTDIFQTYFDIFINDPDYWAKQIVTKGGEFSYAVQNPGKAFFQPITVDIIAKHISGQLTGSWVALDPNNYSKWCAWDCDTDCDALNRIEEELRSWTLNPLRESKRPGRAGHTWLFFDEPVSASLLIRFNEYIQGKTGTVKAGLEFFPKWPTTKSQLRGPLGVHKKPGANSARGWFDGVDQDCETQLEWLAAQSKSSSRVVLDIAIRLLEHDQKSQSLSARTPRALIDKREFRDQVPILHLVPNAKRVGPRFMAQCPVCANEGHDKSKNNLIISGDGKMFRCWYGGGGVHSAKSIVDALKR